MQDIEKQTDIEEQILETLRVVIPKLSTAQKYRLLGNAEGMAMKTEAEEKKPA